MRVEWLESAVVDLEMIVDRIASDKPGAARQFRDDVHEKVASLAAFPLAGRESHRIRDVPLRELVVHKNYLLFYRHDVVRVQVVAVVHVHRNWP
jgi:toxin ParE1/3/4